MATLCWSRLWIYEIRLYTMNQWISLTTSLTHVNSVCHSRIRFKEKQLLIQFCNVNCLVTINKCFFLGIKFFPLSNWIKIVMFVCLFDVAQRLFQQYFSYIVAVRFVGGGNRSTWRKPPTCRKSLTNFIT